MRTLLLFIFLLFSVGIFAQNEYVIVDQILIEGNKKTKEKTIFRELDFEIGDTIRIENLVPRLKLNEALVLNTSLFVFVKMNVKDWDTETNRVSVTIEVSEMWYLYPIPLFELADRNFTIWWSEQNRALDRVNYGLRFAAQNLTGRRDALKFVAQFGYTQKFELSYDLPMIGNSKNWGAFVDAHYSNRKEIAYITEGSRLLFQKQEDEAILLKRFRVGAGTTYRKGIFQYHTAKILYSSNWIGDSIAQVYNPDYFLDSRTRQKHFTFQYDFTVDKRDVKPYPMSGYHYSFFIQKSGFSKSEDVNTLFASASYGRYFPFGKEKKHSFGARVKGRYFFTRDEPPYTHVWALGYLPDVLKGYEFYIIDGMDYALAKTHVRFQVFNREINWGKYMFIPQFKLMPMKIFFTINNDFAYVNAPFNGDRSTFSNRGLWGGGIGLDLVVFYDKIWQFEYSFNHLGERGFYLSWEFSF